MWVQHGAKIPVAERPSSQSAELPLRLHNDVHAAPTHPHPRFRFPVYAAHRPPGARVECLLDIIPWNRYESVPDDVKGVILADLRTACATGRAPSRSIQHAWKRAGVGVCYGAQYLAQTHGGSVEASDSREYGRANLAHVDGSNPLLNG